MRVLVVGIGMGPAHLTGEAHAALARGDYVVALEKQDDDPLLAVRRRVADAAGLPTVVVADPPRDRDPADAEAYRAAVGAWHDARAAALRSVLAARGGTAVLLVWGDPSLYDSTLRLLDRVGRDIPTGRALEVEVVPGISAPQVLAARHGIVLHGVGEPLVVTTARRLPEAVAAGHPNIVVMLTGEPAFDGAEDWKVWWGANLGAPGEQLLHGRVGDLLPAMAEARAHARGTDGWVMDVALLRPPALA